MERQSPADAITRASFPSRLAAVRPPFLGLRSHGTVTGWMTCGPLSGFSSSAWETPVGVMTSMAFGTVPGSTRQIGAVSPAGQIPNENDPGYCVNARAWSPLNPSWPVSTTLNPQPEAGVPNCASGRAIVIVLSAWFASTSGVPTLAPLAFTHTGDANPCTSTRWLQAPDEAIE